jgi:hypothetical protein
MVWVVADYTDRAAWGVYCRSNTAIVDSNWTGDLFAFVRFSSVCLVLCANKCLRTLSFPKELGRCDRNVGVHNSHVEGSVRKYVYSEFIWIFFSAPTRTLYIWLYCYHTTCPDDPRHSLRHLWRGGRSVSLPRWPSMPCVFSHRVTAVPPWQLSLYLWQQSYCLSDGHR